MPDAVLSPDLRERVLAWFDEGKAIVEAMGDPADLPVATNGGTRTRTAIGRANEDAAMAYIKDHPGCSATAIANGLCWSSPTVTGVVGRLIEAKRVRSETDARDRRRKRLYPFDYLTGNGAAGTAKADPRPPAPTGVPEFQGELEPLIWDVLGDRPLTLAGMAVKLKVSANDLSPIAFRMYRRGVLDRLDIHKPQVQVRYGRRT